jgi:hypothetical protein
MKQLCPISKTPMKEVFEETVLSKYDIKYFYSEMSGILQTETPYWLDEAYQDAIADTDTGLVSRNIINTIRLSPILRRLFKPTAKFLDVGGGYGMLARLMRDVGFNFYTSDKHCKNIFAKTFEPGKKFQADAIVAFEVFEHIDNPQEFLREKFQEFSCKTIIFSTLTFNGSIPDKDWWYYAFSTGQHITFYQPRTLSLLAEGFGCKYHQLSPTLHMITDQKLGLFSKVLLNRYLILLYGLFSCVLGLRKSKTTEDHKMMVEQSKLNDDLKK